MWTGNEWIPAPPSDGPEDQVADGLNMQDSVIGGDVVHNTSTVINNDPAAVTSAVILALREMGVVGRNTAPAPPPPTTEVELPPSFQVGDHVEYNSPTNGRWLDRCTVVAINDDGTYRIEVPKSSSIETKHAVVIGSAPGTIRPAAPPYNVGDRVLVNWKNYGTYYPGKIMAENEDHTFSIFFDDEDWEYNVEWSRIQAMVEDSEEVQDYLENVVGAESELIESFQIFDETGTGFISASKFFEILTTMGDEPLPFEEAAETFTELGIDLNSNIDYRELAKWLVTNDDEVEMAQKTEVVIRDAYIEDGDLYGYAYAHPKLGEGPVRTSQIQNVWYDERATARVETRNTIYVVGPTGWNAMPDDHPFLIRYSVGDRVKVEWQGSWWNAQILECDVERYLITYIGFDSSWDEWVTSERIQALTS